MQIIRLDWPPKELSPNRVYKHWGVKYAVAKKAKAHAFKKTKELDADYEGYNAIRLVFYPCRKPGLMNIDNLQASCKAYIDGIAAALGVDDKVFQSIRSEWGDFDKREKFVLIYLTSESR